MEPDYVLREFANKFANRTIAVGQNTKRKLAAAVNDMCDRAVGTFSMTSVCLPKVFHAFSISKKDIPVQRVGGQWFSHSKLEQPKYFMLNLVYAVSDIETLSRITRPARDTRHTP